MALTPRGLLEGCVLGAPQAAHMRPRPWGHGVVRAWPGCRGGRSLSADTEGPSMVSSSLPTTTKTVKYFDKNDKEST